MLCRLLFADKNNNASCVVGLVRSIFRPVVQRAGNPASGWMDGLFVGGLCLLTSTFGWLRFALNVGAVYAHQSQNRRLVRLVAMFGV
jgi:hypothetical protein